MKALDFLKATGRIDDNIILEVTSSMQKNITHTAKPHKRILVLAAAVILILHSESFPMRRDFLAS